MRKRIVLIAFVLSSSVFLLLLIMKLTGVSPFSAAPFSAGNRFTIKSMSGGVGSGFMVLKEFKSVGSIEVFDQKQQSYSIPLSDANKSIKLTVKDTFCNLDSVNNDVSGKVKVEIRYYLNVEFGEKQLGYNMYYMVVPIDVIKEYEIIGMCPPSELKKIAAKGNLVFTPNDFTFMYK